MTGLVDGLAVVCGVAGLAAGLLVLGVSRSGLLALRVALDFWTAAALLRTVGPVSWQRVAGAAAVVGLRQLLSLRRR